MIWKDGIDVKILSFSKHHIDSTVSFDGGKEWRFTGIYGSSKASQKIHNWKLMRRLKEINNFPWLYGGDFNDIIKDEEKYKGLAKNHNCLAQFRNAIDDCELIDMGFRGEIFTLTNMRHRVQFVQERLDWFLCSLGWRVFFLEAVFDDLDYDNSDHRPLFIDLSYSTKDKLLSNTRWVSRFHFEEQWSLQEDCKEIISSC